MRSRGPFRSRIFTQLIAFIVILCTVYLLVQRLDDVQDIGGEEKMGSLEKLSQIKIMQIMAAKNDELKAMFKEAAESPRRIQVESDEEEDDQTGPNMHQLGSLQRKPHQPPAPIQMPEPESEDVLEPEVVYPPRVGLALARRSEPDESSPDSESTSPQQDSSIESSQPDDLRLLLGVFSPLQCSASQQAIRDAYKRFSRRTGIDHLIRGLLLHNL